MNYWIMGLGVIVAGIIFFQPDWIPDWIPLIGLLDNIARLLLAGLALLLAYWMAKG